MHILCPPSSLTNLFGFLDFENYNKLGPIWFSTSSSMLKTKDINLKPSKLSKLTERGILINSNYLLLNTKSNKNPYLFMKRYTRFLHCANPWSIIIIPTTPTRPQTTDLSALDNLGKVKSQRSLLGNPTAGEGSWSPVYGLFVVLGICRSAIVLVLRGLCPLPGDLAEVSRNGAQIIFFIIMLNFLIYFIYIYMWFYSYIYLLMQ